MLRRSITLYFCYEMHITAIYSIFSHSPSYPDAYGVQLQVESINYAILRQVTHLNAQSKVSN